MTEKRVKAWDDERKWQAMLALICGAEKFFLTHDGESEWNALMDEVNRVLDLPDEVLQDNLSERVVPVEIVYRSEK